MLLHVLYVPEWLICEKEKIYAILLQKYRVLGMTRGNFVGDQYSAVKTLLEMSWAWLIIIWFIVSLFAAYKTDTIL